MSIAKSIVQPIVEPIFAPINGDRYQLVWDVNFSEQGVWTTAQRVTASFGESLLGFTDWAKIYASVDNNSHYLATFAGGYAFQAGKKYRADVDCYVPSGQSAVDGLYISLGDSIAGETYNGSQIVSITGEIVHLTWEWTQGALDDDSRINLASGGVSGLSFAGAGSADDDMAYVRNLKVYERIST